MQANNLTLTFNVNDALFKDVIERLREDMNRQIEKQIWASFGVPVDQYYYDHMVPGYKIAVPLKIKRKRVYFVIGGPNNEKRWKEVLDHIKLKPYITDERTGAKVFYCYSFSKMSTKLNTLPPGYVYEVIDIK